LGYNFGTTPLKEHTLFETLKIFRIVEFEIDEFVEFDAEAQECAIVMTLIERHARTTLVSKGDIEGDSPSLARDGVRGTRSSNQLERCSALIQTNWRVCHTCLESL